MGTALETVDFALAAAAAGGNQAFNPGTNQSAAIRATNGQTKAHIIDVNAQLTVAAALTIKSPRLHDDVQGILLEGIAAGQGPLWPLGVVQDVYSQDALIVGANFAAAPVANAIQHATINVYYDDLPGVQAPMRHWSEVQPNIIELVGVQVVPSTGAAPGSWGAGVALNSIFDLLKANQLYAVLGYIAQPTATAIAIQGPDTGNLLCGGPNSPTVDDTRFYFKRMSDATGLPLIPVLNSANKAATLASVAGSAAATAVTATFTLARLSA